MLTVFYASAAILNPGLHKAGAPVDAINLHMSRVFLLFLYISILTTVNGQSKTVEMSVDSSTIYFRYYFKSKNYSEETLSDSVKIVGRRIDDNKFYLDKVVNMQVVWTKIYRIELAKDSLSTITMITDRNGRKKSARSMEPYYKSMIVDQ